MKFQPFTSYLTSGLSSSPFGVSLISLPLFKSFSSKTMMIPIVSKGDESSLKETQNLCGLARNTLIDRPDLDWVKFPGYYIWLSGRLPEDGEPSFVDYAKATADKGLPVNNSRRHFLKCCVGSAAVHGLDMLREGDELLLPIARKALPHHFSAAKALFPLRILTN